jgi:hypothetical protein
MPSGIRLVAAATGRGRSTANRLAARGLAATVAVATVLVATVLLAATTAAVALATAGRLTTAGRSGGAGRGSRSSTGGGRSGTGRGSATAAHIAARLLAAAVAMATVLVAAVLVATATTAVATRRGSTAGRLAAASRLTTTAGEGRLAGDQHQGASHQGSNKTLHGRLLQNPEHKGRRKRKQRKQPVAGTAGPACSRLVRMAVTVTFSDCLAAFAANYTSYRRGCPSLFTNRKIRRNFLQIPRPVAQTMQHMRLVVIAGAKHAGDSIRGCVRDRKALCAERAPLVMKRRRRLGMT